MGINFPKIKEIKLKNPPISEVICQVKFPPILKITKEIPVNFQESVRMRFPGLEIEQGVLLNVGVSPAAETPLVEHTPKIYHFKSENNKSNVSLAMDFLALSTKNYLGWDDFEQDFSFIENAFVSVFQPSYATRLGLRYINRFTKKNTGSSTFDDVLKLFRPEITSLIRASSWSKPLESVSQIVLLDGKAKLSFRSGFGKEDIESFFVLDFDYFDESKLEFNNLTKRIKHYHSVIYQAFRWCLNEDSLELFEPVKENN